MIISELKKGRKVFNYTDITMQPYEIAGFTLKSNPATNTYPRVFIKCPNGTIVPMAMEKAFETFGVLYEPN